METAEAGWQEGERARAAGEAGAAARAYRRVLALVPDFMAGHANLGLVRGLEAAALAPIGRAIALAPGHPLLAFNFGNVLAALGRPGAAGAFRRALGLDPAMSGAWLNLGVARHGEGRLAEAARAALRAASLAPAAPEAWNNLANARRDQGRVEEALGFYDRALERRPGYADAARNRLAARLYLDDDEERAGAAAAAFARRYGATQPRPAKTDPDPDRRLRVGVLSSDLGDHPIGRNLASFVAGRDPGAIWLAAYDTGGRRDTGAGWFRRRVDLWRDVAGSDDGAIAAAIGADAIDVLIVVAGRFDRNRPLVASFRPAPVQVALYDGGPSGMGRGDDPAIAAWITDRWLHPEGEKSGDRLLRVPAYCCFLRPDRPPPAHRPAVDGAVRLGSFSNPAKLSGACLAAWGRILAGLPGARLVLKYRAWYGDPEVRARIAAAIAAAGGDPGRIDFLAAAEPAEAHLARYGEVDLALDPFPFSGATTSFEALAMGVPVLTRAGRAAIGRTTTAILGPLGLEELVAVSDDGYVALALALAGDPPRLVRLRREIPGRLLGSSLLDGAAHAAALTAALRRLWRDWCGKTGASGPGLR